MSFLKVIKEFFKGVNSKMNEELQNYKEAKEEEEKSSIVFGLRGTQLGDTQYYVDVVCSSDEPKDDKHKVIVGIHFTIRNYSLTTDPERSKLYSAFEHKKLFKKTFNRNQDAEFNKLLNNVVKKFKKDKHEHIDNVLVKKLLNEEFDMHIDNWALVISRA